MDKKTLDLALHRQIKSLCQSAYSQFDRQQYQSALQQFFQAWRLIPKPQNLYQESGWVLTAIGDTYIAKEEYNSAAEALRSAICCYLAADNPVIHLMLAQAYFELDQQQQAKDHLSQAVTTGGDKILAQLPRRYHGYL
jgi:tetratricopeptide (TPR) repeat protein